MNRHVPRLLDYAVLAQKHRPTDTAALQAEVRRLATEERLSATDIASALRIDLARVRELLAATATEAAAIHRTHADAGRAAARGRVTEVKS